MCVVQMLLKCADIGHLAADLETHKKWAYQLEEEFFQQVNKLMGLVIQALGDVGPCMLQPAACLTPA